MKLPPLHVWLNNYTRCLSSQIVPFSRHLISDSPSQTHSAKPVVMQCWRDVNDPPGRQQPQSSHGRKLWKPGFFHLLFSRVLELFLPQSENAFSDMIRAWRLWDASAALCYLITYQKRGPFIASGTSAVDRPWISNLPGVHRNCTEENKVASEHRIFGSNFSMKGLTYWGYIISGDQKIKTEL